MTFPSVNLFFVLLIVCVSLSAVHPVLLPQPKVTEETTTPATRGKPNYFIAIIYVNKNITFYGFSFR